MNCRNSTAKVADSLTATLGQPLCIYLVGLVAAQAYAGFLHTALFGLEQLEFLPLMLLSVYCAIGVIASWLWLYYEYLWPTPTGDSTETSKDDKLHAA
jgi:hypothetical protein